MPPDLRVKSLLKTDHRRHTAVRSASLFSCSLYDGEQQLLRESYSRKSRENNNPYHWEDFSIPIENFRVRISEKKISVKKTLENMTRNSKDSKKSFLLRPSS